MAIKGEERIEGRDKGMDGGDYDGASFMAI